MISGNQTQVLLLARLAFHYLSYSLALLPLLFNNCWYLKEGFWVVHQTHMHEKNLLSGIICTNKKYNRF